MSGWPRVLFVATLAGHPSLRVIGMDGQIALLVQTALADLCGSGWTEACRPVPLAFETSDTGQGWFRFHHHNMHVSFK